MKGENIIALYCRLYMTLALPCDCVMIPINSTSSMTGGMWQSFKESCGCVCGVNENDRNERRQFWMQTISNHQCHCQCQ